MAEKIDSYKELRVFNEAFRLTMEIFQLTKKFPTEERYSLTDQVRRSSRSVCLNLGEAWRKRRYPAAFVAKLSDCETEACESQISLMFAKECGYITNELFGKLELRYENVIGMLVNMIDNPDKWTIKKTK